jgi:hypothetical protein
MDSPKRQFLTADEVEANPEILRHPDAREKTRNRDGQIAGASKRHIADPFNWRLVEMQKSAAYRVLSLSARKILDRLEIELARHGFKPEENGRLPCTYGHFVEYGVERKAIAPAIRELVALGFVEVTRKGSAGNADHRQATLFLLTYRPSGSDVVTKNSWRRIKSIEEAEAVAKAARERQGDARSRDFGRRGGLASQAKKQNASSGNRTDVSGENPPMPSSEKPTVEAKSPVPETEPLSILSQGRVSVVQEGVSLTPPPTPPSLVVLWAEFSPSMPRRLASVAIAAPRNPDTIVEPIDGAYLIGGRRIEIRDQAARRNVVSLGLLRTRQRASSSIGSTASARHSASADAR